MMSLIPLPYRILAALALVATLLGSAIAYKHHVFNAGVAQEKARRDAIDADNTVRARAELSTLNALLRAAQDDLAKALIVVATKKKELDDEKAKSTAYQSRLAAGAERMRVLVAGAGQADPTGSPTGSAPGSVDPRAAVEVDLDPRTAIAIDRLRTEHNEAVTRLDACVQSYDAVKAAADAP